MPPCSFTKINNHSAHLLWHIAEPEEVLLRASDLGPAAQAAYQAIRHPRKKREWLAARLALKELLAKWGHAYTDLEKDAWGRPHLANSGLYLSIAHNFPFAFAAVDHENTIGIDIQWPCQKLQSIKEKFLNDEEIRDSGNNLEKLCIYWCAKEAVYKSQGGKNLSLKHDIRISAFTRRDQGTLWGEIGPKFFVIHYSFYNSHVLTWSREAGAQDGISSGQ
jgi:4'-phosphopantetheinyl transferase